MSNLLGRKAVMKLAVFVLLPVAVFLAVAFILNRPQLKVVDAPLPNEFAVGGFSHSTFENLLRVYVDASGRVNYAAWHRAHEDREMLNGYLAAVGRYSPDSFPARFSTTSDALAYWLNAYNATVIKSILDRWPLASVNDVKAPVEFVRGFGFFYRQRYLYGGHAYSLYAIENDKIRAVYQDARIHFVLNCGSESCPKQRTDLSTGDELELFLQQAAQEFVSDERNVSVDHKNSVIWLSEIFKWYKKGFVAALGQRGLSSEHGVIDYIASIGDESLRTEMFKARNYQVTYFNYDWSLNQSK